MPTLGLVVARPGPVRDGLRAVLSAIPGMDVLASADDGALGLDLIGSACPDVVILDSSLPLGEQRATLRQIKRHWEGVRCVVVADNPEDCGMLEVLGADAVLIDGFSAALLSITVKNLLGSHP